MDEAGRGPLAGPVVACAVLAPAELPRGLSRVRDSKLLSAGRREALYREARRAGVRWALASASAAEVDRLNVLRASLDCMARAVRRLAPPPEARVVVDGPYPAPGLSWPQKAVVDGDALSWAVALAGILAKTARDRWMAGLERRHPGYGFARNKGYGTPEHLAALGRLGPCPEHRRSFAPVLDARPA